MKISCQTVSTTLLTLLAVAIVAGVYWQTQGSTKDHGVLKPIGILEDQVLGDGLPVANKRSLRYFVHGGTLGGHGPRPHSSPDSAQTYTFDESKPSSGNRKGKGKGSGDSGSRTETIGQCPADINVHLGEFQSASYASQCQSNMTSIQLMYTARTCAEGVCEGTDDDDVGPLVSCQDSVNYFPSQIILAAYDPDDGTVYFTGRTFTGRPVTISNDGKPFGRRITVESYIEGGEFPAQVYTFRTDCESRRIGCFSGFGSAHVVGWTGVEEGTVVCPRGLGTRALEYTLDFSPKNPNEQESFDLVYAEFATISPTPMDTAVNELIGLEIDPATAPSFTVSGLNVDLDFTTTTETKFTILGLTIPQREICQASLSFEVGGPTAEQYLDSLCSGE